MANIIKLIKCDESKLKGHINEVKLKIESVAGMLFLVATAASLWCMTEKMISLGISSGMTALMALIAYGYSYGIAKFIVLHVERRETLVLTVMPKHE